MTAKVKSEFLNVMIERGRLNQCTDLEALDAAALKSPITGYIGFDATADSLHVGNLAAIMMLRRLQQTGHRPVVLMGGGTTKVGDPSGKDEMRQMTDGRKNRYQHREHQNSVCELSDVRQRQDRRGNGQQRRLA